MAQGSSGWRFTRLLIAMIFTIGLIAPGQMAVAGCAFADVFCTDENVDPPPEDNSGGQGANGGSGTGTVEPNESTGNSSVKSVAKNQKSASKKKKNPRPKANQGGASKKKN